LPGDVVSFFDAMIQEVCCEFAMGDDGNVSCSVGKDIDERKRAFLVVRLASCKRRGRHAVIHRPRDVMPDVRVFYGEQSDSHGIDTCSLVHRGSTTSVPLGAMATFRVEGSIFMPSIIHMRFTRIPQQGEGDVRHQYRPKKRIMLEKNKPDCVYEKNG
jgi:hypothetical protein